MIKVHHILEDLRDSAMVIDAEFANETMSVIRERLSDNDVDLNSGDWDTVIGHINNYFTAWLQRHAFGVVRGHIYDAARAALQVPRHADDIRAWQRDLSECVFPVLATIYRQ